MGDLDSGLGERRGVPEEDSPETFEQRVAEGEVERVRKAMELWLEDLNRFGTPEDLQGRANTAELKAARLIGGGACFMNPNQRQDAAALAANASFLRLQARRSRNGSLKSPTP